MLDLQGKVAIVTGGASGIGRATALLMARAGARVVVADMTEATGVAVVNEIEEGGGVAMFQALDVRREESCEALVQATLSRFGGLDAAFNNAGISGGVGLTDELGMAQWHSVIDVNLTGVFRCMVPQLRHMKEQGKGAIVNTASIAGQMGTPGSAAYSASKHGVIGLTRTAALEYAKHGVRINALCPGYVTTPMTGGSTSEFPSRTLEKALAMTPMRRLGQPEEQAEMVVWLCSDKASFVTGAHFNVDGGFLA